jgi:molybdate transport system substrate-binding protein
MRRHILVALLVLVAATACGSGSGTATLTVLGDSSLTDVLPELGSVYHRLHPEVTVGSTFGGSQELVADVQDGQYADVLVTADEPSMDAVGRYVQARRDIAHNTLTIAVVPGNPLHILAVADLARPSVRVVVAAPNNPAGRYAQQVFAKAGVTVRPAGAEVDVRAVLDQVRTGEADAGLVYLTDLRSAGAAAAGAGIPAAQNVTATYPAAALRRSRHGGAAKAFVAWLATAQAQGVLRAGGFS